MAGDTRQDSSSNTTSTSSISSPPAVPPAPENANALRSGAALNTAGGQIKEAGLIDAVKTVHISELGDVHKKPCVRDALMTGIGAGFGIGGVRAILGASVLLSCNWAAGSFCLGSVVMYEYCQRKRTLEMQGMKRAVEVIDRKRSEKKLEAEKASEAKREANKEK